MGNREGNKEIRMVGEGEGFENKIEEKRLVR